MNEHLIGQEFLLTYMRRQVAKDSLVDRIGVDERDLILGDEQRHIRGDGTRI